MKGMEKSNMWKTCNRYFWNVFLKCSLLFALVLLIYYLGFRTRTNSFIIVSFPTHVNHTTPFGSVSRAFSGYPRETSNLFPIKESDGTLSYEKENRVEGVVTKQPSENDTVKSLRAPDFNSCSGRYIYIHHLPSRFNNDIIKNCSFLIKWFDMCKSLINNGFGPLVANFGTVVESKSWFATDQFSLEIIFHNRMKKYECLTNDSSLASAIYVPFYAGLEVGRHLWEKNLSLRDAAALDLVNWLTEQPEWKYRWGRDHFFVAGRITWDFRRRESISGWGSNLLSLPESKNMTMLTFESFPGSNTEIGIPYPTYFHPASAREVMKWQKRISMLRRKYLYSFVGAARPSQKQSIRGTIMSQCLVSGNKCKLLDCGHSANNCNDPVHVMKTFLSSKFCLQPAGDSSTRRSTFDSILAGCIPIFFHPGTAYDQYVWHLPKNYSKYSIFIPENAIRDGKTIIEKILLGISESQLLAMQKEVINLIPKIIYGDTMSGLEAFEDAFDIAVNGVLDRIGMAPMDMKEEKKS